MPQVFPSSAMWVGNGDAVRSIAGIKYESTQTSDKFFPGRIKCCVIHRYNDGQWNVAKKNYISILLMQYFC